MSTDTLAIADTTEKIAMWQMLARRGALRLEIAGLRRNGRSAYSIVKSEYGFKGNRESVLAQLNAHIESIKALA